MRMSTRGRYGARAMLDIALHGGSGPVSLREMARRQEISVDYLEQLLRKLRKAGLVRSIRGPRGGFCLTRLPKNITMWQIVSAVEPEVAPVHCVDGVVGRRSSRRVCSRTKNCATHRMWAGLAREMRTYLQARTLRDLMNDAKARGDALLSREHPMFYI